MSSHSDLILSTGPIAYWPLLGDFNDRVGTRHGTGNASNFSDSAIPRDGTASAYRIINQVTDSFVVADDIALNIASGPKTYGFWMANFKPGNGPHVTFKFMANYGTGITGAEIAFARHGEYRVVNNGTNLARFNSANNGSYPAFLTDISFICLLAQATPSLTGALYANGTLYSLPNGPGGSASANSRLELTTIQSPTRPKTMSHMTVWDRHLTTTEMAAITEHGMLAYWETQEAF